MIQRIQTLWLLLAACCIAVGFFSPIAQFKLQNDNSGQVTNARLDLIGKDNPEMMNQIMNGEPIVEYSQQFSGFHTWPLIALSIAIIAVAILCIFLYKRRMLQARIVMFAFLLNLVYLFLVFFWAVDKYADTVAKSMGSTVTVVTWSLAAYAPIAALLLLFLAQRAIRKDEAKVRAADRLR